MPTRNNTVLQQANNSYYQIDKDGNISPTVALSPTTSFYTLLYANWTNIPNFKSLSKRQVNGQMHPYSKTTAYFRDSASRLRADARILTPGPDFGKVQSTIYSINFGAAWYPSAFPASHVGDLDQQVTTALLKKLSTAKSSTAVSLAEGGKTAAMVAQTATRLYEALKALKAFRFGDFIRALGITKTREMDIYYGKKKKKLINVLRDDGEKSPYIMSVHPSFPTYSDQKVLHVYRDSGRVIDFLADTWLEYSYGWKPLLGDVYSQAEALATHLVERSNVVRRESQKGKTVQDDKYTYIVPGNSIWTEESVRKIQYFVEVGVFFRIPQGSINPLNTFGINNPLVVLWEVVPFSFVADWFIPIGQFLESLTATNGLEYVSGFVSKRTVVTITRKMYGNGTDMISGAYSLSATGQVDQVDDTLVIERNALLDFPSVCFPRFKDPRSFAHAFSAIALLQSLFLRNGGSNSSKFLR